MQWEITLISIMALCLLACVPVSRAQEATPILTLLDTPLTNATNSSPTISPTRLATSSASSTLSTVTSAHNSTSSAMSQPTHTEMFPGATDPDGTPITTSNVFNYYFLFLVIFAVLVAVLLWWVRRRRLRRKEQMRLNGQDALARDLEGWSGQRRYVHGNAMRHHTIPRREEGLDERGEAPPPYQPKSEFDIAPMSAETDGRPSIPLRTLSRDPAERNVPPGYNASS